MADFEYSISNKGRRIIVYKGFEYVHHRETSNGNIHWRCAKFRTMHCRSLIHTKGDKIVREPNEHSHSARVFEAEARKLVSEMKIRMSNPGATAPSIVADVILDAPEDVKMCLPKKNSLTRRLQYAKSRVTENLPDNPDSKHFIIPKKYADLVLHDSGIDDPDRIILIGDLTMLNLLGTNDLWLVDGTFKTIPEVYYHLCSIHVQFDSGAIFTCLLALLPNKNEQIYVKMLNALLTLIPEAQPRKILTDFKTTSMRAFHAIFPDIEIGGCLFHMSQFVICKVTECGLKPLFESNLDFAICIKMLPLLCLLPEDEVLAGFFDVADNFSTFNDYDEAIEGLLISFERIYIRGRQLKDSTYKEPLFPMSIWNHRQYTINCIARANAVEEWHYRLQSFFCSSNPTVWKFFEVLEKELSFQHGHYLQYCVGQRNPRQAKYESMAKRITDIVKDYDSSKRLNFLRSMYHMT